MCPREQIRAVTLCELYPFVFKILHILEVFEPKVHPQVICFEDFAQEKGGGGYPPPQKQEPPRPTHGGLFVFNNLDRTARLIDANVVRILRWLRLTLDRNRCDRIIRSFLRKTYELRLEVILRKLHICTGFK